MKNNTSKFQARIFHSSNGSVYVTLIWNVGLKLYNQKIVFRGENTMVRQELKDGSKALIHLNRDKFPMEVTILSKTEGTNHRIEDVTTTMKTSR